MCQNVSKKVLLKRPKLNAKIPSRKRFLIQRATEIHPLSKNERLRDTGHKISIVLDTRK